MAIQNRRGIYSDFDPTKMIEGEFAVVQSGDPNTSDGKAVYISTQTGSVERIALYKDVTQAVSTAIDEVAEDVIEDINEGVAENVERAETAADNAEASAEEAAEILENKADVDGTYPSLYAGNLSSTRKYIDTVPYISRRTAGGASKIGEREDDTLVGATMGMNQQIKTLDQVGGLQGVTRTYADGVATYTPTDYTFSSKGWYTTSAQFKSIENHVYFITCDVNPDYDGVFKFGFDEARTVSLQANKYTTVTYLRKRSTSQSLVLYLNSTDWTSGSFKVKDCMCIDLTAMLGSTIADYLYSLEQATAGAGVAKLKEWGFLTDEYIPYNPGSLESVEATAHKMVGFNQWDEEWENGGFNAVGTPTVSQEIRSKNFISVFPNTQYCFTTPVWGVIYQFDAGHNFLLRTPLIGGSQSPLFTTLQNTAYIKFYLQAIYGNTYNHDICINLSSDRNGEYEPYSAHTYDLGTDTLRGLFKLDANNNLYADGDRKEADGTITRRYGVVDLGSLNYAYQDYNSRFVATTAISDAKPNGSATTIGNMMCALFPAVSPDGTTDSSVAEGISLGISDSIVRIRTHKWSDVATFKTAMSGVMLVYELATPTTEQSTPFTSPQICDPDGTEEYVTSNGVPVGHETEYDYDIKGLAEELIDVPDVPSTNGTYVLKATRSASGISYEWVSEA